MAGWKERFINQTLRTAILKGWKKEDILFEIFERLNSGSVKLSPMELRMSLHAGEFLRHLIKWSEEPRNLHRLLRLKKPDPRMADAELTLRFIAFRRNQYRQLVSDNHGVTESDQKSLLLPIGIDPELIDFILMNDLHAFGGRRGNIAHTFSLIRTEMALGDINQKIDAISAGLRKIDEAACVTLSRKMPSS
jgi:hypothetical protein